jgi:hypothetical protein
MWLRAEVTMNFTRRLCGSIPLKKEMVRPWLESRMPNKKPQDSKLVEEIEQEVLETIEDIEERITLGFQRVDGALVIRGGTLKSHLKDCSNQVKDILAPKIKALRSKVANKLFIDDYFVPLLREEKPIEKEDGEFDQPVHVITAMGPRNALKTIQFINQPVARFRLRLLKDKEITPEVVEQVFEYGSIHGYGGERSMGEGRYSFKIDWEGEV